MMKRLLLLILTFGITLSSFSQKNADYNYSLAFRGYTLTQLPKILNETNPEKYSNLFFSGLMFKFNDNQIGYRINGNYYNKNKQFFNNCEQCEEAFGKLSGYSFKIGFEKNINYAVIQPYFAFDIGYSSSDFKGNLENRNVLQEQRSGAMEKVKTSKRGIVVSPVFGLKLNPISQVSIFIETSLDIFHFYETQDLVSADVNNTRSFNKYVKTEYLINPVSVGIQIHLGHNK